MSLTVKETTGGTAYPQIEAGTYVARCVGVIDLGVQVNAFNGKEQERVRIVWELPTERVATDEGTKPRWISKPYTASLHEKATLRHDIDAWRGKPFTKEELAGFSLPKLIGAPCMLSVIHAEGQNGKTYVRVGSVSKPMKGMEIPAVESETFCFDMDADDAESVLSVLPQWMQDEVRKSPTWESLHKPNFAVIEDNDDDLPF